MMETQEKATSNTGYHRRLSKLSTHKQQKIKNKEERQFLQFNYESQKFYPFHPGIKFIPFLIRLARKTKVGMHLTYANFRFNYGCLPHFISRINSFSYSSRIHLAV